MSVLVSISMRIGNKTLLSDILVTFKLKLRLKVSFEFAKFGEIDVLFFYFS